MVEQMLHCLNRGLSGTFYMYRVTSYCLFDLLDTNSLCHPESSHLLKLWYQHLDTAEVGCI